MRHPGPYTLRFRLYAIAHGKRPEDIPSGQNTNAAFINWINARWVQWDALVGHPGRGRTEADMEAFDIWLTAWVGALPQEPETAQAELAL